MEEQLTHGGDWAGFEAQYGKAPLDFSANISPLGLPAGVRQAVLDALDSADRYPDPLCRDLRRAIAAYESCDASQILCGNGAADLIFRAVYALRPRRAIVTAPTFAEYEQALRSVGCEVVHHVLPAQTAFRLDASILDAITAQTQMLFLCEPNNPTGVSTDWKLMQRILDRCRETNTILVLDACFDFFLDKPQADHWTAQLAAYPNLLVLKAFTKAFGMAGLRLGYALCANPALLAAMRHAGQPWGVSSLAQAAGVAALRETAYAAQVRDLISTQRREMTQVLRALGVYVVPGEANYLLFRCERPLCEPLRERGILLRSCANYRGLDETWYRAAVRSAEENRRFLEALREVLE